MRFAAVALLGALSSTVLAQNLLDNLPECAQTCFGDNFANCGQNDFRCICSNTALISGLSCCVSQTCSSGEQTSIIQLADSLCGSYGVTVPTSAGCSASASPTPSASGSSNNTSNNTSASGTPTLTGSTTPTGSPAGQSTGAAPLHTAGLMGLAMAGLLAAL